MLAVLYSGLTSLVLQLAHYRQLQTCINKQQRKILAGAACQQDGAEHPKPAEADYSCYSKRYRAMSKEAVLRRKLDAPLAETELNRIDMPETFIIRLRHVESYSAQTLDMLHVWIVQF